MADLQVHIRSAGASAENLDDVDMEGDDVEITDVAETGGGEEEDQKPPVRTTFIEYVGFSSNGPIVLLMR